MNTKQKILKAIDCAIDDIGEDRLVDILLDAFKAKKARIAELEGQLTAAAREVHDVWESRRLERHEIRTNPLYSAAGEYFFIVNDRKFMIQVFGPRIEMFERCGKIDHAAQIINRDHFEAKWP